jgi:hypothetical protein
LAGFCKEINKVGQDFGVRQDFVKKSIELGRILEFGRIL